MLIHARCMRPCLLYIRYCIKWYFPINLFVIAVESILENKKQGAKWVLVHWQKGFKHYQESPLYQTPVYWRSFKRVLGLLLQSQLITLFTSDQFLYKKNCIQHQCPCAISYNSQDIECFFNWQHANPHLRCIFCMLMLLTVEY